MNLSQKQIAIIGAAAIIIVVVAVLIFFNLQPNRNAAVQLTVWGFEKGDLVGGILSSYSQIHPNVNITYKQVSQNDYENTLLSALASGQGPDVFPIHNRGLAKNFSVLYPADPSQITPAKLDSLFPAEVSSDFAATAPNSPSNAASQVYAVPFYFDTLALIYNKNLFDQAGIATPPATWDEFQSDVSKLRSISPSGQITRAGASIGGSQKTITNAVDLLSVLMLQNGAGTAAQGYANFSSSGNGAGAFSFYLQFASPSSNYYTWNESQPNDFDSFAAGNTAIVFGYNSDVQKIKNKSPFLRIGVAPLPQVNMNNAVNYADYWGLAVSKQSRNPTWAWDFIVNMATQSQISGQYLTATGQPPALRDLISKKINDSLLGVFAKQALTARSLDTPDENSSNNILNNAIISGLSNPSSAGEILRRAQDQINQLMKRQ